MKNRLFDIPEFTQIEKGYFLSIIKKKKKSFTVKAINK